MNRLSAQWFRFWKNRKIIFSTILLSALVLLGFLTQYLNIYEDITKTLPQSDQFEKLAKVVSHRGLNSSIYFSVRSNDNWNSEEMELLGEEFVEEINLRCEDELSRLQFKIGEDERDFYWFIDSRVPLYLESTDYKEIRNVLHRDSVVDRLNSNHEKLYTPEGFILKDFMMNDPLGITGRAMLKFKSLESQSVFTVQDDLFMMPEDESLFLTGNVELDEEDAEGKAKLAETLSSIAEDYKEKGIEVEYFSSFLIANANAQQIKKDTILTLSIALTAILLLLFFYYRSLILPVFFVIPAIVGLLFSIGVLALVKDEISAISIGAGAVVLGIIMDYSFHFFTHLKHSGSIEETLDDITAPLLTGCLTTILAFLALTFTTSPVLQDFGLFAAFSLVGAAVAVLFCMPILLPEKLVGTWKNKKEINLSIKIPKLGKRIIGLGVIGFTVVAIMYAPEIQFDDDLMNLNYYPDELKEAEKKFQNIDPDTERRAFIISSSSSREVAKSANYEATQRLEEFRKEGSVTSILSTAVLDVPVDQQAVKIGMWNSFWLAEANELDLLLDSMENTLGYYENTFDSFKNKIDGHYQLDKSSREVPLVSADMKKLIDSTDGEWTYITFLTVKADKRDSVVSILHKDLKNSEVFDRSEMAGSLVNVVQSDFNFILLASSLLVFLTLLVIYGRIELTLITFLPMVLSWIWILGIAAMVGIEFNFVNIVISTFIFGLGDDFAIFITDGYVSKYSRNKDSITAYKRGIVLSALTTVIGTGALIFAVHPALNSVATISVVGLVAIVIISFTVQPWLLNRMLIKRKEKGLPPVSLVNLIFQIWCWTCFLTGCATLIPVLLLFRIMPFGQKKFKYVYHLMMQLYAWCQMYFMINTRKKVIDRENFDFSKPSVIIANHQSQIDVIMMMTFHPKMIILTNDWVYNSPIFGPQIRYLGFLPGSGGVETSLEKIKPWIEDGYSLMIFPEGTRSKNKEIGRFHKGAFFLAEELGLDIQPVILHGFNDSMRKGDFMLLNGKMTVKVLPRISKDDASWGEGYKARNKSIARWFKDQFRQFDLQNSDSYYLQHKIISAYIFRSPLIEWYVKVKWMFEKKNFDRYHEIIPTEGRVYDLGCGYGYLSYYLHFRSEQRHLIGVDYDADKINIAENCYLMNPGMEFHAGDIRTVDYKDAAAIFLNDVIHYLPEEDHEPTLERCLNGLAPNGVLIIRDGVTDLNDRHKKTELTEKYSTKIIGFNKTENHLCFFSKQFIQDFAEKHGLSCEISEQSQKTSNILFVLKRRETNE